MALRPQNAGTTGTAASGPIRVMVVDDSAVVRGLETRMLEEDPSIRVVASVGNGQMALQALDRHDIEVVILDIEMPVMDGLTALPQMLKKDSRLKVVIASTLTLKNAEVSLKAMSMGASDYLAKPTSSRELSGGTSDFRRDLVDKVRALGAARRAATGGSAPRPAPRPATPAPAPVPSSARSSAATAISLRQPSSDRPDVIAIGSSTGGPQALFAVLGEIKAGGGVRQPIIITQHMPATFTTILAGHIGRVAGVPTAEATDGMPIKDGHIYIAPGDWHMVVETQGVSKVLRLNQDPPENFCRPAVDPMFRSVAKAYGRRSLGVVLTGMGSDGAKGSVVIADAGGTIIAQDEASSVVWGMPGATVHAGSCSAVLPLKDIAAFILRSANKR